MKNLFTTLFLLCTLFTQVCANNPMRTIPYPQQEHTIYINPAPLLVPNALKRFRSAYASCPGQIHENVRETPFPQKHNT